MEAYDPSQAIITASFDELKSIVEWADNRETSHHGQNIFLIGGWAVHSFNNYFGSIDIDLYTNSKTKASLMYYLKKNRGYKPHGASEINSSVSKMTGAGEIIIDFLSDESDGTFKGRKEIFGFDKLRERSVVRVVDGDLRMRMPERTLLLIYKLKAFWDRTWTVENENVPNANYLRGKIVKDGSDILALIDPEHGGMEIDLNYFGSQLKRLDFLKEQLRMIPESDDTIKKYGRMDARTAKDICDKMLSLIS